MVPGADADQVLRLSAVSALSGERMGATRALYGISEGLVVQVPDTAGGRLRPVADPLGSDVPDPPGQLAVSWYADRFAVVNRDQDALYLASAGSAEIAAVTTRSEERRVGKECRSRWSPYH